MRPMPHDLPAWAAELTDPRRARTLEELADRLVPLAEHAIDVSRRLQGLLGELNGPFDRQALYERVERLKARVEEAMEEIGAELAAFGRERVERIDAACIRRLLPAGSEPAPPETAEPAARLRERVAEEIGPLIEQQRRAVAEQVRARARQALDQAVQVMLGRIEELARHTTDLVHEVLPLAREGVELAGRITELSGRARRAGPGPITPDLSAEAAQTVTVFEETVGRLELEWAGLGSRTATVKAALRGAEEAAFSQVGAEMTRCVQELAPGHAQALNEVEERAMELLRELSPELG